MTKKLFSAPFLAFILCGTIIPMCVIAFYGLTDRSGAFTWANVTAIAGSEHAKALGLSLLLAFASTVICLILAFPLGLISEGQQTWKKRIYGLCFYPSDVDELSSADDGMAGFA